MSIVSGGEYEIISRGEDGVPKPLKLRVGSKIGEGAQGSVLIGELEGTGPVAIKYMKAKSPEAAGSLMKTIRQEMKVVTKISKKKTCHPNINCFYGILIANDLSVPPNDFFYYMPKAKLGADEFIFIYEFIEGRTLDKIGKILDPAKIEKYGRQLLQAIEHMHKNNIVHHDLKRENIMIDASDNLHLIDFGISCENGESCMYSGFSAQSAAPETRHLFFLDMFSTDFKTAILRNYIDFLASDMFSIGCIIYSMISGEDLLPPAFNNPIELYDAAVASLNLPAPFEKYKELILQCLSYDKARFQFIDNIIEKEKQLRKITDEMGNGNSTRNLDEKLRAVMEEKAKHGNDFKNMENINAIAEKAEANDEKYADLVDAIDYYRIAKTTNERMGGISREIMERKAALEGAIRELKASFAANIGTAGDKKIGRGRPTATAALNAWNELHPRANAVAAEVPAAAGQVAAAAAAMTAAVNAAAAETTTGGRRKSRRSKRTKKITRKNRKHK